MQKNTKAMSKILIEVCSYSVQSAITAQQAGAYRVELCSGPLQGGLTPSYGEIKHARKSLSIKLHVIIRPRCGDFCYSALELDTMKSDIENAKQLGADGIAIGVLTEDGMIDEKRMKELIKHAQPMSVTFHRAFDCTSNPFDALKQLTELGIERVLTSGMKNSVDEGRTNLIKLSEAAEDKIIIMPGGGVNEKNIISLASATKAKEFHLSGKSIIKSKALYKNADVSFNAGYEIPDYDYVESNKEKIKQVVELVNKI